MIWTVLPLDTLQLRLKVRRKEVRSFVCEPLQSVCKPLQESEVGRESSPVIDFHYLWPSRCPWAATASNSLEALLHRSLRGLKFTHWSCALVLSSCKKLSVLETAGSDPLRLTACHDTMKKSMRLRPNTSRRTMERGPTR